MPQSSRPSLEEVRAVFRLLGDLRDLRQDPAAWERLMVERLCGLTGARQGTCLRLGNFQPGAVPVFHSATHAGWISATGAAVWEEKLRSGEIEADPQIIRATRVPGDVATIIRQELVSDEEFYANDLIRELLRITDIDAHLAGWCRTGAGGEVLGMAFHREYRGPPASPRQRSVLRLFLDEFHRLWHAGKMAAANGTAGEESRPESHLSPRERQVLEGLLGGLTVKQVATNLGLSHRTVEGHVKSLHRKYNVNSRGELLARCLRKF